MVLWFSFIPQRNGKKSTVSSYNLIWNHFHTKLKGNSFEMKQNLNSSESARINLPTVMAEWLFNSKLPSLKESEMSRYRLFKLICLLSLLFLCVIHLWVRRYWRHVVNNDATRNSVTWSLTLCHVTENGYVKCPVHFFGRNIFHLLSYEQNLLTNRIADKLMNIKKFKELLCLRRKFSLILPWAEVEFSNDAEDFVISIYW